MIILLISKGWTKDTKGGWFTSISSLGFMSKLIMRSPWIDALPTRWGFETQLNTILLQQVTLLISKGWKKASKGGWFASIYNFDFMPKKTLRCLWIDALPTRWGFETRLNLIWLQSVQSKIKPANNVDSMTRRKIENFLIDLQKITRVNILMSLHLGCRVLNCGKKYEDCQTPITKKCCIGK